MKSLILLMNLVLATPADEFHFNNGAEPEGLDPHRTQSHDAALLNYQQFEMLVSRKNDYFSLRGGLAESWTTSKDGTTWTLKMRPGIKWSNGEPITIEQIRSGMIRAMDPKVAAPYVNWFTDYIVGAADYVKEFNTPKKAEADKALGIKILNPTTLEIKLVKPVAFFGYLLSNPIFAVVHPTMYDPDSPAWKDPANFIGNGPYKLKEWKVNQRIVMERSPTYWDAANVKIPKLVSYAINDQQTTFNMYQSGQLDWTGDNQVNPALVPSLKKRNDFKFTPSFGTYLYVFNTRKPPFNNKKIRKAFSLAINTPEITDKILKNGTVPAYRLVPPGIPAYKEPISLPTEMTARIAEAKKLLAEGIAESNFPGGKLPAVTLLYNTQEAHHKIAQAIQRMWKDALGVQVEIRNSEWKVVLAEQKVGNFDIVRFGWIGDFPDPSTFVDFLTTNSENNNGKYSNKTVDENYLKAAAERDPAKRFKLLAEAERLIVEEAAVAPIYHYVWYSLMNPKVSTFEPNIFGHYYFKDMVKNQ